MLLLVFRRPIAVLPMVSMSPHHEDMHERTEEEDEERCVTQDRFPLESIRKSDEHRNADEDEDEHALVHATTHN